MAPSDVKQSYDSQSQHEAHEMLEIPAIIAAESTVGAWRHRRLLEAVLGFAKPFPDALWLTVGDGRYGSYAAFLKRHGIRGIASTLRTRRFGKQRPLDTSKSTALRTLSI